MEKPLWQMVAFLCRYGHQPVTVVMGLTITDSWKLVEAIGELLQAENKAGGGMREWAAGGG